MSFWMPKRKPVYAPMLSTFGGGSLNGFRSGVSSEPVYIARVAGVADEISSFPSTTSFMSRTWSHNGGNADGGTISISGSGQYKLYSISMGKRVSASGNVPTITMKVYTGTSANSSNIVSSQNITYPAQTDTSSPYQAQELVFPTPVTLDRGTTYAVAYGMATPGLNVNSGAVLGVSDNKRTSYSISSENGGGTLTFGDMALDGADSDPFDASNGTNFVSNGNGQLPIFGFIF